MIMVMIDHNVRRTSHFRDKIIVKPVQKLFYDRPKFSKANTDAPQMLMKTCLAAIGQIIALPYTSPSLKKEILEKRWWKKWRYFLRNLKDDSDSYPIVRSMVKLPEGLVMLIAAQYLSSANHIAKLLLGGISALHQQVIIIGAGIVGSMQLELPLH